MAAVAAAPKQLFNWNLTEASTPAVVARAKCIEDVQRILSDKEHFPSPVSAVAPQCNGLVILITYTHVLLIWIGHRLLHLLMVTRKRARPPRTHPTASATLLQELKHTLIANVFILQVLAVGALHSVNACITNSGGTMLNMSDMNAVLGLESHGVRVQAGCKMADIYDWLGKNVSRSRSRSSGGSVHFPTASAAVVDGLSLHWVL